MKAVDIPELVQLPWADGAGPTFINSIPTPSQIGITTGLASLTDGFPPVTFLDEGAGGQPPFGADFNGILNLISANTRWNNAGGTAQYNSAFSAYVGGYPKGAILLSANMSGQWLSLVDDNATNPDTGGAGWASLGAYGLYSLSSTGGTVTLTAPQYAKRIIIISGTLTGNLQITFPKLVGQWLVVNNAVLNSFAVTASTTGGTSIPIAAGANSIYGDGVNVINAAPQDPNIIASGTLSTSGDNSITLPAGNWSNVELEVIGGSAGANAYAAYIGFNNDQTGLYFYAVTAADNVGNTFQSGTAAGGISIFQNTVLQQATNTSLYPLNFRLQMKLPKSTSFYKTISIAGTNYKNNSTGGNGFTNVGGVYGSTSAIASIQLRLRNSPGPSPSGSVVNLTAGTWILRALK